MAKKNDLITGALWLGGGWVAYKIAAGGGLGPAAKTFAEQLRAGLGKMFGTISGGPGVLPPGTVPPQLPPTQTTPPGGTPQMDSNNFVSAYSTGFVVYVGGNQVNGIYATQGEAERAYNTARGFPN